MGVTQDLETRSWWIYTVSQTIEGPLTFGDIFRLSNERGQNFILLVWCEGAKNWTSFSSIEQIPLGDVEEAGSKRPPVSHCDLCHATVPPNYAIRLLGRIVCAACKPTFVQALQEGAPLPGTPRFGTFGQRAAAKLIDQMVFLAGVNAAVIQFFYFLKLDDIRETSPVLFLALWELFIAVFPFVFGVLYNTILVARYGATFGKMALGLRIVTAGCERVSFLRALGRSLAEMISSLVFYLGYWVAAFDEEKRTWHDHICGTRVIQP